MALLNEINVKGVPHPIVTDDGYYQEMTVGDAEQLVATTFTEDDAPYNFRTAGGAIDIGDRKQVEGIVGGTVAWNQAVQATDYTTVTKNGITFTNNGDGSITVNGTATVTTYKNGVYTFLENHVYYWHMCPAGGSDSTYFGDTGAGLGRDNGSGKIGKATTYAGYKYMRLCIVEGTTVNNLKFYPQMFDLTQMFGSTIADYIYSLETANAGAGVAWFKKYFPKPYYAYNAGELMSVKALRHITRGFNAWDGVQEQGIYDVSTGLPVANTSNYRNKNFVPVLPNTKYCYSNENAAAGIRLCYYDANKQFITSRSNGNTNPQTFITPQNAHYVTFYWSDISKVCINLSWDGERDGEYEEYAEHMYELDPDLELRGIPKLSAGNDLYYDGDTYESDGTVTRKYGIVDLGSLTWAYATDNEYNVFYAEKTTLPALPAYTADKITTISSRFVSLYNCSFSVFANGSTSVNNSIAITSYGTLQRVLVRADEYTSASAFKTAMSGVYLVYELATPTTETADPYNGTQIVDDFGTEEFVDAGVAASTPTRDVAIPVGHNSLYQPNLRAKLEMVPEAPEDEGYYVVYHHDGINEYVPLIIPQELPNLPSEDGTYTLKCTVASGSATLSFESEV